MRRKNSRSTIFLTEVILALTIFALCSSVCVSLIFLAHQTNEDSYNLNQAVFAAQNAVELFKANPDLDSLATSLGGRVEGQNCYVDYDDDWQQQQGADAFQLQLAINATENDLWRATVVVVAGDEEIYDLESAVYAMEGAR